jgi:hypothetical protein
VLSKKSSATLSSISSGEETNPMPATDTHICPILSHMLQNYIYLTSFDDCVGMQAEVPTPKAPSASSCKSGFARTGSRTSLCLSQFSCRTTGTTSVTEAPGGHDNEGPCRSPKYLRRPVIRRRSRRPRRCRRSARHQGPPAEGPTREETCHHPMGLG